MLSSKVTAIVLKRANFSEADKLITLFTKERGKIKVVAKGLRRIKSRRAAHLELFNLTDLVLHAGKNFDLITEAKALNQFVNSKKNLEKTGYLFYLAEVLDRILPEEQPHPEVFGHLLDSLCHAEHSCHPELVSGSLADASSNKLRDPDIRQDDMQKLVKNFVVELLWDLGYLPRGQYPKEGVTAFVESITEHKIRSKKFLEEL